MARRRTITELTEIEVAAFMRHCVATQEAVQPLQSKLRVDSDLYRALDDFHDALNTVALRVSGRDTVPWDSKHGWTP
ncbi:hypothetical protein [Tianweitania sediminis]|uniref:Uncharacterized protein n=1 Tax=Tianweitania sediminis TaxID=1502156 RepID=A0A8J7R0E1_9HYPH|nr:hypothetical protein [Tianweitania sediminis]MBP0439565.1 hypothetical protein [Tianweitania sediminis]